MKTNLLHQLSMIPHITVQDVSVESVAHQYFDWELLEIDEEFEQVLICKPCTATWTYTRSKHLLILCDDVAVVWLRASNIANNMCHKGAVALDTISSVPCDGDFSTPTICSDVTMSDLNANE